MDNTPTAEAVTLASAPGPDMGPEDSVRRVGAASVALRPLSLNNRPTRAGAADLTVPAVSSFAGMA